MLIGIDMGGTYIDIVLLDPKEGTIDLLKVNSTPGRLEQGVLHGLQLIC